MGRGVTCKLGRPQTRARMGLCPPRPGDSAVGPLIPYLAKGSPRHSLGERTERPLHAGADGSQSLPSSGRGLALIVNARKTGSERRWERKERTGRGGHPLCAERPRPPALPSRPSAPLPAPCSRQCEATAQTLAWPCLSRGPTPCLWAQEGRDPRAIASPKPNKARPWSLLASSLVVPYPA